MNPDVQALFAASRALVPRALPLLNAAAAGDFDAKFTAIEPLLTAWYDAFNRAGLSDKSMASKIGETVLPILDAIAKKAIKLGATKGQKLSVAPAAGGFKMPRKYTRKYCKKTPCKKMGFTQRSSCRPYKNCFTRGARRRS